MTIAMDRQNRSTLLQECHHQRPTTDRPWIACHHSKILWSESIPDASRGALPLYVAQSDSGILWLSTIAWDGRKDLCNRSAHEWRACVKFSGRLGENVPMCWNAAIVCWPLLTVCEKSRRPHISSVCPGLRWVAIWIFGVNEGQSLKESIETA